MWCLGLCAQTVTGSGAFFGQTLLSCLHPTLGSLMPQLTLQFYWEKQTNQPFFTEPFPELRLHVICLVCNTQTKCTEIVFICLTSTAFNHLKLRNIPVPTVEGRQTKKNQCSGFFQTWKTRATSSSILTKAKIQPDIYYFSVQSPSCVKNDSPGFLLHRCQALYRPARSAHTDSHYILGKRNLIHSRWQARTHIYLQNPRFQAAQTVKK